MKKMESKILQGIKPFNQIALKSCYYNQMVAGYSIFNVKPEIIASNYLPLYQFDEEENVLDTNNKDIYNDKDFESLTGVKKTFYNQVDNIEKFIIRQINKGNPIIVPVDCFYLTYREDTYRKQHLSHFLLVYGYDCSTKEFVINEHMYLNSPDYAQRKVPMAVVEKANANFYARLLRYESNALTVLSKKKTHHESFESIFIKSINKNKAEIQKSQEAFVKCVDFMISSIKDKEACKKEQDVFIDFFGKIRWFKTVQKNVLIYVYDNKKLNEIVNRIEENYIFVYGMMVKFKVANFYNEKSVIKVIDRCSELKELELKLHKFLMGEKYE